jgi:uncharacterized protein YacL
MKLTTRVVNTYGYASIALMLVMVAVILMQWVPRSWFYPLFAVAVTLFMIRITMRLVLARQERVVREEQKSRSASDEPPATKQAP